MSTGLAPVSQTLSPLPKSLHSGLIAIFVLACISFVCSALLFIYLSYKLVIWHFSIRHQQDEEFRRQHEDYQEEEQVEQKPEEHRRNSSQHAKDFTLGIDGPPIKLSRSSPNQFLILIYNLLLADLHQSLAFTLNGRWLYSNGIIVGTPTCFTQGLFVSTGDLSSSLFITLVAIHTYLSVVKGYRPSQKVLYSTIGLVWFFVYFVSVLPIIITRNGASVGGFFVRAVSWCWINDVYERTRLVTHYLYIFIALATTSGLYIAIWISLRKQARQRANHPNLAMEGHSDHNPAFLLYPIIYVMCTLPLALGRLLTMAGVDVPTGYFCFAGAMISFNGFFDCFLFGTTRHAIIFASKYNLDDEDTGVKTIAFLQTPKTRRYGNMVWIQGGKRRKTDDGVTTTGGWWSWQRLTKNCEKRKERKRPRGSSQESLRGIQMDMVTTVVVEMEDGKDHFRYPSKAASTNISLSSIEREEPKEI
ncbi:hypothetical protein PT974_01248 [Cladobotryum mycophilum]|uniref:G-protein coupled receptors family 1 profile domain-containing protein n=1 Tax=Cladobotryum mycophilum TaxID=491253 RepID=A0ABR0T366_9HYPO